MNVLKTLFFLSLGLIIFQTCSKDEISTTSSDHQSEEEQLTIQEELLRTVKASSEDGVLYFDNSPDFHRALDVLDTISLVDQPASPVTSKSSHRGAELPGRKPPIALAMNDFRPLVQHHADVDLM